MFGQGPPVLVFNEVYPGLQSPKKLLTLANGQLMITGGCWYCLPSNLPGASIMLVDTNGVLLWQKYYPSLSAYDEIADVAPATSGGFWAVGHTEYDALLMRLNVQQRL